ncbi:hypothetical protein HPP92_021988 [Vanilla planifolia]|uniref:Uncharacterized protein n=1 Tax=Vanilla planifolia TaxID=51239 RepID=A0A835PWE9_VANPL|nr:hypothetical protein HPP92_021988 [Vanilla planifolia]
MIFCCLPAASGRRSAPSNVIRVVDLHGHVEFFYPPTTVEHAIGKSPRDIAVWTAARLISSLRIPLRPDDELLPGVLYFVLPHAAVSQADSSLACLASLIRRLTAIANRSKPDRVPKWVAAVAAVASEAEPAGSVVASARPHSWRPRLDTIEELLSVGW